MPRSPWSAGCSPPRRRSAIPGMRWSRIRPRRRSPPRSTRCATGSPPSSATGSAPRISPVCRGRRGSACCARNWRGVAGFIVPRADEYQGEYVPRRGQRLAWLTGFTGSAGMAVVLADRAALFVDGRYTLQAAAQADTALFELHHLVDDPWLHTPQEVERFRAACERAGGTLRAVDDNPLDKVWPGQPPPPLAPVRP